jgi:hypothetical protein
MKRSILCTLCLIKVLNVANMARGRQACGCLYACTYVSTDLALAQLTVSGTSSMGNLLQIGSGALSLLKSFDKVTYRKKPFSPQRLAATCHNRAQQGPARRSTAGHGIQDGIGCSLRASLARTPWDSVQIVIKFASHKVRKVSKCTAITW